MENVLNLASKHNVKDDKFVFYSAVDACKKEERIKRAEIFDYSS